MDSILSVNQELVATTAGASVPLAPPEKLFTQSTRQMRGAPSEPQGEPKVGRSSSSAQRVTDKVLEGVDVAAAVEEAFRVGHAGGDPVPSLTALYERIGFCAIQGEDENERGIQSLPTSPSRGIVHKKNSDDEGMCHPRRQEPTGARTFFSSRDGSEVLESPRRWATGRHLDRDESGSSEDGGEHGPGNGMTCGGGAIKGYSFAHSPLARVTSLAERSPEVLERLEALESQLEQEKAGVEKQYKKIVRKVGAGQRHCNDTDAVALFAT